MGFSTALSYSLLDPCLSVGVEAQYERTTAKGSRDDPVNEFLLGPSIQWRPFRGVHLDAVIQQLRQIRVLWLVPALLSIFVRFWLTAVRWRVLLGSTKRIGLHRLFGVTMIGFMANNVFPARIGEFVRAYALGRSESLAAPLAFATIVIERIFDGLTLLLFLGGGLFFFSGGGASDSSPGGGPLLFAPERRSASTLSASTPLLSRIPRTKW